MMLTRNNVNQDDTKPLLANHGNKIQKSGYYIASFTETKS